MDPLGFTSIFRTFRSGVGDRLEATEQEADRKPDEEQARLEGGLAAPVEAEASRQPSIPEWSMRPFIDNIGIVGIIG